MATDGAALVENRAGITFGVELYVPWDAPEAVVPLEYYTLENCAQDIINACITIYKIIQET